MLVAASLLVNRKERTREREREREREKERVTANRSNRSKQGNNIQVLSFNNEG